VAALGVALAQPVEVSWWIECVTADSSGDDGALRGAPGSSSRQLAECLTGAEYRERAAWP